MANLKKEYTDIRNQTHTVEHIVMPVEDITAREQIIEELFCILAKTGKNFCREEDEVKRQLFCTLENL